MNDEKQLLSHLTARQCKTAMTLHSYQLCVNGGVRDLLVCKLIVHGIKLSFLPASPPESFLERLSVCFSLPGSNAGSPE